MLGDFAITALSDGVFDRKPRELLTHATPEQIEAVLTVQFPEPQVTTAFDTDSSAAAAQRIKAYADAARGRYLVAASHLPFPGIGHIRADGKGYAWVPIDWNAIR
ncbi:MAG: hypothetical protein ABIO71_13395 [Caldimonas sp.]